MPKLPSGARIFSLALGIILIVGAGLGVAYWGTLTNKPPLRIAVARADIQPGEQLRGERVSVVEQTLDAGLASLYVQERDLAGYIGAYAVDVIRRGEPLLLVKLSTNAPQVASKSRRYALALNDPDQIVMSIKVGDNIPPAIARGDFVNIILAGGAPTGLDTLPGAASPAPAPDATARTYVAGAPATLEATGAVTRRAAGIDPALAAGTALTAQVAAPTLADQALSLPFAAGLLESVEVLDVIREERAASGPGAAADNGEDLAAPSGALGSVTHLVVRVPRAYQNLVAFGAATHRLQFALVSAAATGRPRQPQMVVDWNGVVDLVKWQAQQTSWRGQSITDTLYPGYVPLSGPQATQLNAAVPTVAPPDSSGLSEAPGKP